MGCYSTLSLATSLTRDDMLRDSHPSTICSRTTLLSLLPLINGSVPSNNVVTAIHRLQLPDRNGYRWGEYPLSRPSPFTKFFRLCHGSLFMNPRMDDEYPRVSIGEPPLLTSPFIRGGGFPFLWRFRRVGYKARVEDQGRLLYLKLGYSHEVELPVLLAMRVFCFKKNMVCCTIIDKQRVHQFAAIVCNCKPLEVYKGKGTMYINEVIKRKQGKKSKL
ncbi:hypothetical protein PIB30_012418 [Stylosanthes scabra]|uniref:Large ribosomal subunit protein uL6 alpha-beta domain-containing protein n=1 Tax=Stylosanthes scabra TaxID=79078 RepID=A0ABU6R6B3_9FABA|nr:hypothetical protein [Stylosanthes scabra]